MCSKFATRSLQKVMPWITYPLLVNPMALDKPSKDVLTGPIARLEEIRGYCHQIIEVN